MKETDVAWEKAFIITFRSSLITSFREPFVFKKNEKKDNIIQQKRSERQLIRDV